MSFSSLKRIPRKLWVRLAIFVGLLVLGFVLIRFTPLGGLFTEERMRAVIGEIRQLWWAPLLLVGLYVILAPMGLPMTPLLLAGAVFGPLLGAVYNTLGLFLGGTASFHVARFLGRDFVEHLAGKKLRRAERLFERSGFWPLVQTRFVPFPFAVVNFGAGLAGVKPPLFYVTSVVGLIPATTLHTFFMAKLIEVESAGQAGFLGGIYVGTFALFNLVISIPSIRQTIRRRRLYRELVERRAARGTGNGTNVS